MGAVNAASMMVTLVDSSKRKRDIWQVIDGVQAEAIRTIPGIRRLAIKEMGADVMASQRRADPGHLLRPRAGEALGDRRAGQEAGRGDPRLLPGVHLLGPDAAPASRRGGPGPRPGAGPHRQRRGGPGLLRPEGRADQRVLPPGQQAAVHHPAALPAGPAEGPGRPGAGQDRREEGRGRPPHLGGPDRGAPGTHPHRARQLPPGHLSPRLLPEGRTAQHGAVHGPPHGGLRQDQLPARATAWSCAGT